MGPPSGGPDPEGGVVYIRVGYIYVPYICIYVTLAGPCAPHAPTHGGHVVVVMGRNPCMVWGPFPTDDHA